MFTAYIRKIRRSEPDSFRTNLLFAFFTMALGISPLAHALPLDSANDFGGIGLLQTPTARFSDVGEFRLGYGAVNPYSQYLVSATIAPWLEGSFRYVDINNRLYGPVAFSGNQTYKDRGVDLKLRMAEEGKLFPAIAIGLVDLGGTGLFSSEYFVASKRWGAFDYSLGIGWGRLGAGGTIKNPFGIFSDKFKKRDSDFGLGGVPSFNRFFRGKEVGLFGGVQWNTPIYGLTLKLELDGNDYQSEALANNQAISSRLNFGLNYAGSFYDIGLGYERGNTAMARLNFRPNFTRDYGPPKLLDPAPTPMSAAPPPVPATENASLDEVLTGSDDVALNTELIAEEFKRQKMTLLSIRELPKLKTLQVWYSQSLYVDIKVGHRRAMRTLAILAPERLKRFEITLVDGGLPHESFKVSRRAIMDYIVTPTSPDAIWKHVRRIRSELANEEFDLPDSQPTWVSPAFTWSTGPGLRQSIGGPDRFYFYQIWWHVGGKLQVSPTTSIGASVGFNVYNNFDELKLQSDSNLPHVRSDIAEYLKEGKNGLVRLELNKVGELAPNLYGRFSAGIFEEMFGGVAGEILYRPTGKIWALGLDLNRVRQRGYDQKLDFRDYEVTTGHLTTYLHLPNQIDARLSVGQYLAGDRGATLNISRTFRNNVSIGVFATKTNVSAQQFGEGSFDKGFYVDVPFDIFLASSSRRRANLLFRPLTRDGGQMVRDGTPLYGLVEESQ